MKIGLVYGHVASNLGDLSINMGVANIINKIFPESILHVVYKNPNEKYFKDAINSFGNLHNIEYYILNVPADKEYKVLERYIRNPLQFLEETGLNKCDVILANSGEFLFSYEFDERIDLLWRVLPAYASMQAGIKFITLPSTLGPFNDFIGTKILKQYLLLNDTFAARDALSLQLVAELLETNIKKLHLFLDPAFFIKEIEDKNISDGPRLGVIMRLDNFGLRTGGRKSSVNYRKYKKENFKTSLAYKTSREIIDKFINIENGKVDLYVQTRYDLELAESIYEFYANKGLNERISIIKPKTIESYIDSLSNSNFVVSSRFHGCILSFLANVPAMGIYFESHGHKMPGLYKMLDIEDYSFKLTETNVEEIGLKFIELYKNKYRSFNHLKEKVNSLKSETLSWLKQSLIEKTIKNKEVISSELMEYLGNVKFNIIENKLLKLEEQNSQLQKNIKNLEKKISEKKAQLLKTTKDYEELKLKIDHLIEVFNEVNNKLYFFEVQNKGVSIILCK